MNAAPITKIEYMLPGDSTFTEFAYVPESGKMTPAPSAPSAGTLYKTTIDFLIAGVSVESESEMKLLQNRKAYFKATRADGLICSVGSVAYPARMTAQLELGGAPGEFNGYRCTITHLSPDGVSVE
jgi:hypothetical protein